MIINLENKKNIKLNEIRISGLIRAREVCGEIPIARGYIKVPTEKESNLNNLEYEEFVEKLFPGIVASKILGKKCIDPKPLLDRSKSNYIKEVMSINKKGLSREDLKAVIYKKNCSKCKKIIKTEDVILKDKDIAPIEIHLLPNIKHPYWWGLAILYYKHVLCHSKCKNKIGYLINRKRIHYFGSPVVFTLEYWYNLFPKAKIFGNVFRKDMFNSKIFNINPLLAVGETPEIVISNNRGND